MTLDETALPLFAADLSDHDAPSPSAHLLDALQLHGYRPFQDEPDPRPLPDGNAVAGAAADMLPSRAVVSKARKALSGRRGGAMSAS